MNINAVSVNLFGREYLLRGTRGAKKLLRQQCGDDAFQKIISGDAISEAVYFLAHDENGNPPEGLTLESLKDDWKNPSANDADLIASILAAFANEPAKKNELLQSLTGALRSNLLSMSTPSSDSVPKSSGSPDPNIGGDTLKQKSPPESTPTVKRISKALNRATSTSGPSRRKSATRSAPTATTTSSALATSSL